MHNMVYLIGRLTKDVEVEEKDNDKQLAIASIAVQRTYKDDDGSYPTDFFDVALWNSIAINTAKYCKKGDLVGIRAKLQSNAYTTEDGITFHGIDIIADKISFLSSKKEDE